jgi:hypothetical protein
MFEAVPTTVQLLHGSDRLVLESTVNEADWMFVK